MGFFSVSNHKKKLKTDTAKSSLFQSKVDFEICIFNTFLLETGLLA